ncbi:MAG: hypothetical protein Q4A82_00530 [Corynebacterium sp.]|nr:hypothetical protein [Corynebacterium sp.]
MESPESSPHHPEPSFEESFIMLMSQAHKADYGKEKILAWEELVGKARHTDDDELLLATLFELGEAYIYGGEIHRLPIAFQEARDICAELEPQLQLEWGHNLGKQYKYYMTALVDHPDTPAAELRSELEELRDFWSSNADTMKEYYLRAYYVFQELGDKPAAEEAFTLWLAEPREEGSFSECPSCSPIHQIKALQARGNTTDAILTGEQALARTDDFCSAQPENLYLALLEPWIYAGRVKEARRAHRKTLLRDMYSQVGAEFYAQHFTYYALLSMRGHRFHYWRGLEFFRSHISYWLEMESSRALMDCAAAAALFLRQHPKPHRRMRLRFAGESLPWIIAPDLHDPTIAEAAQWCADIALNLARRFDARPGLAHPHTVADVEHKIFHTKKP